MFSIIKIKAIVDYLNYYNIDYYMLSTDVQAIVVVLFNIFAVLFFFVCFYILYRLINKFLGLIF